jgi:hypothetical protein
MTIFTPLKAVYGELWVRAVFLWVRSSATGMPAIRTLSFIHFARWGVVARLPRYGQPRERLRRPLFMFESNYNGSFEAYIDAFAQILGSGMAAFWGTSYGFPGPLPVKPFKTYIRVNEFVAAHYYSAYPAASVTGVVAAVELSRKLETLRPKLPGLDAGAFAKAYADLFAPPAANEPPPGRGRQVANLVKEIRAAARAILDRAPGHGSPCGRSYAFTSLVPIRPGHESELAAYLGEMAGQASPFAALPHVHFARLVIVDQLRSEWAGAPRRPPRLRSSYLLFTAAVTALPEEDPGELPGLLLRSMDTTVPEVAHGVWRHCYGYTGTATAPELRAYLPKSQVGTLLFYVGCPDTTVAETRTALVRRQRLDAFAMANQGTDPAALRQAFEEESASWS